MSSLPSGPDASAWRVALRRSHNAVDPRTEIPPPDVLPYRSQRRAPYLYRKAQIAQLLAAARQLPSATGLRAHTYATVFGLFAVSGMRISELVALDNDDVDVGDGLLTLRHTKFGKSRCLPLHPTTRQALCGSGHLRDRVYPIPNSPSVFVSEQGTRVTHWAVRATFVQLSRQIGLRGPTASHGPRLHDFRHRFAVQTLVRWASGGRRCRTPPARAVDLPWACQDQRYLLVSECHSGAARLRHPTRRPHRG